MSSKNKKCPECDAVMNSCWICNNNKHYICSEECLDNHVCNENDKILTSDGGCGK